MGGKIRSGRRLFVLGAIKTTAILGLVGRLYYLQIVEHKKYKALSDNNRIRASLLSAKRGAILDNTGARMAYNEKQYDLVFAPVKDIDIGDSVSKLLDILQLSQSEYHALYSIINNANESVILVEDISWGGVRKIEFNLIELPGMFIVTSHKRHYTSGAVLAHVIGYVRRNYQNGVYTYLGISGVEYACNKNLEGGSGILQEEINSKMQVVRLLSKIVSKTGADITLSINYELQHFIHGILDHTGTAIVLDVNNGNVLAMNSCPSYDNNLFVKSITNKQWDELRKDKASPLFHRAVALKTPPGSTFKLISAVAALESGVIGSDTIVVCKGHINIGNKIFRCWKKDGHGAISLNEAIASSCNVYFYHIGQRISINNLCDVAQRFGFGLLSGMGLKEELSGVIPDSRWRKKNNKRWYTGDTVNSAIGHGYVLVTPLQLAVMTARLATGKKVVPSIINITAKMDFAPIVVTDDHVRSVRRGMYSAINSFIGTARRVYSDVQSIAGKTGTAQISSVTNGAKDENHSLFVGYAPYEKPKYSISVVMERSAGGGASRIAKKIFDYMYINKF